METLYWFCYCCGETEEYITEEYARRQLVDHGVDLADSEMVPGEKMTFNHCRVPDFDTVDELWGQWIWGPEAG